MNAYGFASGPAYGDSNLGIVGTPERSMAGNLVLRVGHEVSGGSWTQTEHVVLTPDEASEFLTKCKELMSQ